MKHTVYRNWFAGMVGNFLEHYDIALFALLAPFIAPLFFAKADPLTALILTYGMLPLGLITRPLSALLFGWIGDTFGRKQALSLSLMGMAITSVFMGFLPLHKNIGSWAPLLLALGRMTQGIFAAGEVSGGALFVLEHTSTSKRSLVSSYYDASSVGGTLFASLLVACLSSYNLIETGWRYLFWMGGLTAVLGIILRRSSSAITEHLIKPQRTRFPLFTILKRHLKPFLGIVIAAGFSHTTYALAFTLMNGLVPLVTSLSKAQVMQVNTLLLLYDMLLLPLMGYLANRFGKEKVMITGAFSSVLCALPLFYFLDHASLGTVILIRIVLVSFGVSFAAPYYAWAIEQAPYRHRYLLLALGGALGSQCIGMPTAALCLWLYQLLGWSCVPGIYLQIIGALAGFTVLFSLQKTKSLALVSK